MEPESGLSKLIFMTCQQLSSLTLLRKMPSKLLCAWE